MNYFKNIFVGLGVISIFVLHPSLNKGDSPITYLQYLVYGNSLNISSNDAVDLKALEIKSAKSFSNSFIDGLKTFARFSEIKAENGFVVYGGDENFSFKDFNIVSWRNLERVKD